MVEQTLILNGGARRASETSTLVRLALDSQLGFATKDQLYAADPEEAKANLVMHDYFKLAAQGGGVAMLRTEDEAELEAQGRDERHMRALKGYVAHNQAHSAMSDRHLALQLESFGIPFDKSTADQDRRNVLEAFSKAQALATHLHDPRVQASRAPLEYLLEFDDRGADARRDLLVMPDKSGCLATAATEDGHGSAHLEPPPSQAPMLSAVIDEVVDCIIEVGKWKAGKGGTAQDARRVIKQFVWIVGDRPVDKYTQRDCAILAAELRLTPLGLRVQKRWHEPYATVKASFPTGQHLKARNPLTTNKEMCYFSTFCDQMHAEGYWTKDQLKVAGLKKKVTLSAKKKAKKPWTVEHMRIFFKAPIWRGCSGYHGRLTTKRSVKVYHDAAYWLLLMLWWMGTRLNEAAGLMLDEVITDGVHLPHVIIAENELRTIKTEAGERMLPIPKRLIDLGFLDYVAAMRREGHGLLFPELWTTKLGGGDQFARIVWKKLLNWYLKQPGAIRPAGAAGKLADMHSIRTCFVSLTSRAPNKSQWRQMVGHEGEGVTEITYDRLIEMGQLQNYLIDLNAIIDTYVIDPCPDLVATKITLLRLAARSR